MAVSVYIAPAGLELADAMAPEMRPADVAEVWASGGRDPHRALYESILWSEEASAVFLDGELAGVFGIGPASGLPGVGIPWLLGTPALQRHPHAVHRLGRYFVSLWLEKYQALEQMVDLRNRVSLRWLSRLGFKVEDPAPWGYEGRPFCRVHIERGN